MRVIWAYANWNKKPGESDIEKYSFQLAAMKTSVLSWMKYAPTWERVLYVDDLVYTFLSSIDYIRYWDRVEIVDFSREIDRRYGTHFFAYPKIWAFTQQTEPFFICDTDVVLHSSIGKWFDCKRYFGVPYDHSEKGKVNRNTSLSKFVQFESQFKKAPGIRSFCDYTNSVNGCLFFFSDPRVAQIVGTYIMSLSSYLDDADGESWVLYEEAILKNLVEFITGQDVLEIPSTWFHEYCVENCQVEESIDKFNSMISKLEMDNLISYQEFQHQSLLSKIGLKVRGVVKNIGTDE